MKAKKDCIPVNKMTSDEKGRLLERAVHALERAILADSPAYSERTFGIEPRKVLSRDGVRHEIDLYVSIEITPVHSVVKFYLTCADGGNHSVLVGRAT